jgi:DNA-binding protein Fis
VSQVLVARAFDRTQPAHSLPALAAALLARAQRGELNDAHAQVLAEAEREVVTQAILLAQGNQARAARWLGLSRFTLREKLKQLGLHPGHHEEP